MGDLIDVIFAEKYNISWRVWVSGIDRCKLGILSGIGVSQLGDLYEFVRDLHVISK